VTTFVFLPEGVVAQAIYFIGEIEVRLGSEGKMFLKRSDGKELELL
jgi:hypothetical protein